MHDYIKELPFTDTEFEVEGIKFLWGGEFQVDQYGDVVGLNIEWLGKGPDRVFFSVPQLQDAIETLPQKCARALANVLEKTARIEIKDAVDEWHVERAEESFSPRREYGTLRVVNGSVA